MKKATSGILMRIRNITRQNKILLACVAVVLLTLALRFDIFKPSIHNAEWNTTTVLRHLEIWDMEGPLRYNFNPVITYPGAANQNIDNHASTEEGMLAYQGNSGEYYYTSYPQFGYIAPYLFFKALFMEPNVVGLRIFNVLVQIATAFFVYKIVLYLTREKVSAFVGFASAMLLPVGMHYFAYNYMSDMLVPLFFASTAYLFLRIVAEPTYSKKLATFFVLSMFLMIYTEYLGLFVSGVMLLFGFANRKEQYARLVIWACTIVPAATVFLVAYQYATVGNLDVFLQVMVNRYANSYAPQTTLDAVRDLYWGYRNWFGPAIFSIASLLIFRFVALNASGEALSIAEDKSYRIKVALAVLFFPVLIHHVCLLSWTAFHARYFSTLKALPLVAVVVALAFWYLMYCMRFDSRPRMLLAALVILGCGLAASLNISWNVLARDIKPYSYCGAGEYMGKVARNDQVVFVRDSRLSRHDFPISPVFVYCAKRNIEIYTSANNARELMLKNGVESGVIVTIAYFDYAGVSVIDTDEITI